MSATVTPTELVTVTIDGIAVRVPKGTLLVEAAKQIQRDIPVYCYHEKLGPAGLCRICLVEIEKMPKLQIACNTPVADGMVVHTMNDRVDGGRRAVLEFLLLNHPLDCPICDKGGECDLQDYSMAYGRGSSRLADAKTPKPKAVDLGPTIVLDEERCIVCQRCVRFDEIITREQSLRTDDRGAHVIIATATGEPYVSDFSGNVTELCPVGALTSKTYRFKSRPWDNHRVTTTCTQCSVGCQMHVDARVNRVARTMSVAEDDAISDGWLCDRGRYNVGFLDDERRLTTPLLRDGDEQLQIGWDDAIAMWADAIKRSIAKDGASSIAAIGGGRLLNEEAFLLAHVHRALGLENLDWRAGRAFRAHPGSRGGTHVDLENADAIVTFGRPPAELAPILDLRIRKAVSRRGVTLISIGDQPASRVLKTLPVADVDAARAAIPATASNIAFVWDGIDRAGHEAFLAAADALAGEGKAVTTFISGEQPNARGAESMGLLPRAGGLDTRAILEAAANGKIGVLAFVGVNPLLHYPDPELVERAIDATPFVVVTELFATATARRANLVLPVCAAFEKSGTTTDLAGDVLPVHGAVVAPEGVLADGDILVMLAERLGVEIPSASAIERRVAQLAVEIPERPVAQPRGASVPADDGLLRVAFASTIFSGGGTVAHDSRIESLRPHAVARLAPATAIAAGLAEGDVVDVIAAGDAGRLEALRVELREDVREGVAVLLEGVVAAPVNRLGDALAVRIANVRPAHVAVRAGAPS